MLRRLKTVGCRALIALVVFLNLPVVLMAKPPAYQVYLVDHSKTRDPRLRVLLSENLPQVELLEIGPRERYSRYPHWPVAACGEAEYFLTAYGKRLISVGCLGAANAGSAIAAMHKAIAGEERLTRVADATTAMDAALGSAAFGDIVSARALAKDAAVGGFPERGLLRRLQKFLGEP